MRHKCYAGKGGWQHCILCDGRIHDPECTAKVDPKKDCCPKRHERMGLDANKAQVRAIRK